MFSSDLNEKYLTLQFKMNKKNCSNRYSIEIEKDLGTGDSIQNIRLR
jgi:hypothetical protein